MIKAMENRIQIIVVVSNALTWLDGNGNLKPV
jgi:hypothetical protein